MRPPHLLQLAGLTLALSAGCAQGQTDDAAPFYAGGSAGVSHVSNLFRQTAASNNDTVISTGALAGMNQRWGRQKLTADGSVQHNRYSNNRDLSNQSYSLRSALDWQTLGNLSGTLSANTSRALADFNIGGGVDPIYKKNTERNQEYASLVRLGLLTRYSVEAGWIHRERQFSAAEYDRFTYSQNTGQLGVYATPGGNVKLGLVGRRTHGLYPRYPIGVAFNPGTAQLELVSAENRFKRNDLDFTTTWETGGSSSLNTRLSRSRVTNELSVLRDFSGTTGSVGWSWRPTAKLQLGAQYSRDTGQESLTRAADVNRVYTGWRATANYALTGKIGLNANLARNRSHRASDGSVSDAFDNDQTFALGLNWAVTRGWSMACQYNHASRDSSVAAYVYSASSYGCTGQALFY